MQKYFLFKNNLPVDTNKINATLLSIQKPTHLANLSQKAYRYNRLP